MNTYMFWAPTMVNALQVLEAAEPLMIENTSVVEVKKSGTRFMIILIDVTPFQKDGYRFDNGHGTAIWQCNDGIRAIASEPLNS